MSLLFAVAEARVYDAIALIVEGEAVTTSEIRAVQTQLSISKKEAVDMLIQDRLQKIAMKNIYVSENEVDKKIKFIAQSNNITTQKMQQVLKAQGTSWTKYRESIKNAIKKEKFFNDVVAKEIPEPTEDQLRLFYDKNKARFVMPSTIAVTEYSAKDQSTIEAFLKTKKGLNGKAQTKKTAELNPAMQQMLLSTPDGGFTRPMNAGDKYVVYKVRSKSGQSSIGYEDAKPIATRAWKQEQQTKALKDYFSKMKTRADIQIIRE